MNPYQPNINHIEAIKAKANTEAAAGAVSDETRTAIQSIAPHIQPEESDLLTLAGVDPSHAASLIPVYQMFALIQALLDPKMYDSCKGDDWISFGQHGSLNVVEVDRQTREERWVPGWATHVVHFYITAEDESVGNEFATFVVGLDGPTHNLLMVPDRVRIALFEGGFNHQGQKQ